MSEDETVTNCHQLKPVPCGCGGEANVIFPFMNTDMYLVECNNCGICTSSYDTKFEAITAWNRAMGNDYKSKSVERTAKVIFLETKGNPKIIVWKCAECGQYMHRASWAREVNYCSHCGAKLDWGEDDE